MKKIYNLLVEYAKKKGIYGNCCYLSEYKTEPCSIDFKPKNNDFYEHMKRCPYYHSNLEKRRIIKNIENEICKYAIKDGKWVDDKETIDCSKKDYCNKYHTRNEVFFDEKNYRKLYPCTEVYYCEKGELCPKKHAIDIKIEEIYLPVKRKNELETKLKELIEKNEDIKAELQKFDKVICKSCISFIDGAQGRNMYIFKNCPHIICSNCYEYYKSCPICGFTKDINDDKKDDNNATLIKIDGNVIIKNDNKKKCKNKEDEKEEENDRSNDHKKFKKKDIDLNDIENNYNKNDDYIASDISDFEANFSEVKGKISDEEEKEKEKESEKENNHSRKGVKRGKGISIRNDYNGNRRNNDYYQDYNDDNYSYNNKRRKK